MKPYAALIALSVLALTHAPAAQAQKLSCSKAAAKGCSNAEMTYYAGCRQKPKPEQQACFNFGRSEWKRCMAGHGCG